MERLQPTEGSSPDPVAEWSSPGGETGLEEPMWQLGLGGGGGGGDDSYPERPDEADCIYYLRTGFCGYGSRCRFNHPRDRNLVVGAMRASGGEYPERVGQPVCQYYMRTGMCKFGASCKYHHPRHGVGSASSVAISVSGYPLRPGEKECSYYLKTGQCKFGVTCKFHHPHPDGTHVPARALFPAAATVPSAIYPAMQSPGPSSQQYGVVAGNWQVARPALLPGSYVQGTYGPVILPPGMVPMAGWNPYQASLSPVASPSAQSNAGAGPIYGMPQLSSTAPVFAGPYLSMTSPAVHSAYNQKEHAFPERPGQPECQHYMKTGECKFGSSCKYHHPAQWSSPKTNFVLSPMGLPLRPGAPLCSHYALNGICKFGHSCKFDHPMSTLSYSPSASSLTDMPVAPYPVGSSMATLAPSSSSSELKPDKEAFVTKMSTPLSTAAGSVGSILSRNDTLPQSSIQQPGQSSTTSTGSSTPHISEVPTSG
ncbi:zinc finger CCCH domain-containing protein 34 [Daucus carota subsp. sativus]|uniref:zinc finger CCCH domain-containing protein 34 n=1 Tax=Daucus carota subsp. sativus TaxID=79200 RepID=UPI0007EF5D31|nr:PREDICTED: zinc finger CCCH domain-containing protein 34-like isoform X1 [Daucus carota subsp. sativus]XP_017223074.1 PREDICTED: zinc finger CCCH domain-containing protein 34-like isoform X2 [Daucus carota subsp. sativus]